MDGETFYNGVKNRIQPQLKIAKDQSNEKIPTNMTLAGAVVPPSDIAEGFARHFHDKIEVIKGGIAVKNETVYNGVNKLIVDERFFMSELDVAECIFTPPFITMQVYGLLVV